MSRTVLQCMAITARQFGHPWPITGTADSGGSTTVLRDSILKTYPDDWLNGAWIHLTSGSPSLTELLVTDFDGTTNGDATFKPALAAAPDTLTYNIYPYSPTEVQNALQDACLELYDRGLLTRQFWMRMVGGSPLYNADWSYWTSSSVVDGWARNGSGTIARERDSAFIANSETSLKLSTTADYVKLSAPWKRFLEDMKGYTVTFFCPVKTSTASAGRLNLYDGANNYSAYHGGGGAWELLHVEVAVSATATDLEPRLVNDDTAAVYFGMPFVLAGQEIREYPVSTKMYPHGPNEVRVMRSGIQKDYIAAGRGLVNIRQFGKQYALSDYGWLRHHDEATTTDLGILDFGISRRPPRNGEYMMARGSGPLSWSTTITDNVEVNETESLLLGTKAAMLLIERNGSQTQDARERLAFLSRQFENLSGGVGQTRGAAALPIRW